MERVGRGIELQAGDQSSVRGLCLCSSGSEREQPWMKTILPRSIDSKVIQEIPL